jgi:hypothetical protein
MVMAMLVGLCSALAPTAPLRPTSHHARAVVVASLPADEAAQRAKEMLEKKDYAGAALESGRALDALPDLSKVSVLRGRALMLPLLERMMREADAGEPRPERSEFKPAWDAFRLALVMDPNNAEAEEELEALGQVLKFLDSAEPETTVEVDTAPSSSAASATSVRAVEIEEVDELDAEFAAGPDAESDVDVVIVGAGAAGIGCAVSLIHTFGLESSRVLLIERGEAVGESFRRWPDEMRFISPSFNQAGWTNSFDLNSVAYGSSPAYTLHSQHPSGAQYADYLSELVELAGLRVQLKSDVLQLQKKDGAFDVRVRTGGADGVEEMLRARYVVWAAGEFQYPRESAADTVAGSEHCTHNSHVRSWAGLPGDDFVLIGGCVLSGVSPRIAPVPSRLRSAFARHRIAALSPFCSVGTRAAWMRPSIWRGLANRPPCSHRAPRGMCKRPTRPPSWRRTLRSGSAR